MKLSQNSLLLFHAKNAPPLISSVYVDHYEGFRLGTAYLLNKGHEKIGICLARKTSVNSMEREKAFADTLRNEGKTLHPEWIFHQCYTMQDGAQILHRIVNMKNRPTAILQRTIKLQLVY